MREEVIYVDTEEIKGFFMQELMQRGFVPSENELMNIADITFDFLVAKRIIDQESD
jgi:YozD-like protein